MISAIKNRVAKINLPYNRNEIISLSLIKKQFNLLFKIPPLLLPPVKTAIFSL